jgi:hypothetical protein
MYDKKPIPLSKAAKPTKAMKKAPFKPCPGCTSPAACKIKGVCAAKAQKFK